MWILYTFIKYYAGIQVINSAGKALKCQAILLICSADLPARALVSNMKAFNGAYGCSVCTDSGEQGACSTHRIWPFTTTNTIRSREDTYKAIQDAVQEGKAVSTIICIYIYIYMHRDKSPHLFPKA